MVIFEMFLMVFSFVSTIIGGFFFIIFKSIYKMFKRDPVHKYYRKISIGNDQLAGTTFYETEDFTISSNTYYLHIKGNNWATKLMSFIDFLAKCVVFVPYYSSKLINFVLKSLRISKRVTLIKETTWREQQRHCETSFYAELEEMENKVRRIKKDLEEIKKLVVEKNESSRL